MLDFSPPELQERLYVEVISQLTGAVFITIFGIWAYFFQKRRERWSKHWSAVVELEYLLNEHIDETSLNVFLLKGSKKIIKDGGYSYNEFHFLRLVEDIELRLADLNLINKSFFYKTGVVRLNRSMLAFNRSNNQLLLLALNGISQNDIDQNRMHLLAQLKEIEKFANSTVEETKELLCFVRVYLRINKNIFTKTLNRLRHFKESFISTEMIKAERIKLENEIKFG